MALGITSRVTTSPSDRSSKVLKNGGLHTGLRLMPMPSPSRHNNRNTRVQKQAPPAEDSIASERRALRLRLSRIESLKEAGIKIQGCLKPAGKELAEFVKEFKTRQDDAWLFRNVCERVNTWCQVYGIEEIVDTYKSLRDSTNTFCGRPFDDALFDWKGLFALYWFIWYQHYVPPDIKSLMETLKELLLVIYGTQEELEKRLAETTKLMVARNPHTRQIMATENGFSADRHLFVPKYPYWMEGVLCTSQCFRRRNCGLCLGCTAYRDWYIANDGASMGADPPRFPPFPKPPSPDNGHPSGQVLRGWKPSAQAWPTGSASGNGSHPKSSIWAPRK